LVPLGFVLCAAEWLGPDYLRIAVDADLIGKHICIHDKSGFLPTITFVEEAEKAGK